jgi:hypothetical protein
MKKELLQIEFRYSDAPKDRGKSFDSYYTAFDFAINEALKLI